MKRIFVSLFPILCFLTSCSYENTTWNKKELEIENLKEQVRHLEIEYGMNIIVNEDIWQKKLPRAVDIERFLIKTNQKLELLRDSVNRDYAQLSSYTFPKKKTRSEYDPPLTGSFSDSHVFIFPGQYYYDVSLDVDWIYGGHGWNNNVTFTASVTEEYPHLYQHSHTETVNPYYVFWDESFTGSVRIHYYRNNISSLGTTGITAMFQADVSYNSTFGVGTIRFIDLN